MKIMSHEMLRRFIVKVSVLGYFPLHIYIYIYTNNRVMYTYYNQRYIYLRLYLKIN